MAERIATLAQVRRVKAEATKRDEDGMKMFMRADAAVVLCATVERLAEALSTLRTLCIKEGHLLDDSTDWVTTLNDTRALLTQLGAKS